MKTLRVGRCRCWSVSGKDVLSCRYSGIESGTRGMKELVSVLCRKGEEGGGERAAVVAATLLAGWAS